MFVLLATLRSHFTFIIFHTCYPAVTLAILRSLYPVILSTLRSNIYLACHLAFTLATRRSHFTCHFSRLLPCAHILNLSFFTRATLRSHLLPGVHILPLIFFTSATLRSHLFDSTLLLGYPLFRTSILAPLLRYPLLHSSLSFVISNFITLVAGPLLDSFNETKGFYHSNNGTGPSAADPGLVLCCGTLNRTPSLPTENIQLNGSGVVE